MLNKPNAYPKSPASGARPRVAQAPSVLRAGAASGREAVPVDDLWPSPQGEEGGSSLIVGPQVKLRGAEILDCDMLVVEGEVAASMSSRVLRVARGGSFEGRVEVDVAEIHGRFEGELLARERLLIHSGGRVSGTIRYGAILIEQGGELGGDIQTVTAEAARERRKPQVVSVSGDAAVA